MAKKTYQEKLHSPGGLPRIADLSDKPETMKRLGGPLMLIAAPLQYHQLMAKIPYGKVTTVDRIRAYLAKQAGADVTCPLTGGIFINICAHASLEAGAAQIPWWRTLKARGELNEKYPEGQRQLLEMEGHTIVQKGKGYFVADFAEKLFDLRELDGDE